ncbi:hypothetical protein AVEN_24092-1 [Araneus ventricosus]|uniref:F-box domain-containing protein n=1 Tax=Araneus ventricosus TaxID=182803 RepID=A0A4Y2GIY8_ARAVE|nr:hypothetical protein AVEN_24092-1 [Araneus ventricosus]
MQSRPCAKELRSSLSSCLLFAHGLDAIHTERLRSTTHSSVVMDPVSERGNNGREVLLLQNLCLKFISENFQRVKLPSSTTTNEEQKFNLKFLQKKYSTYFIEEAKRLMGRSAKLDNSYFLFLLNGYETKVDMSIFPKAYWPAVVERVKEVGHGFHEVNFKQDIRSSDSPSFKEVEEFVNEILPHLPNVKTLDLTESCNDTTLEIISLNCLKLEKLIIDKCSVTNMGLKNLCPLPLEPNLIEVKHPNVKYLSLLYVNDVQEGIGIILQNMPSLEVVMHHDVHNILYELHDMNRNLERKYNLTSLRIYSDKLQRNNLIDILNLFSDICPNIKQLQLPLETEEELYLCLKFKNLEDFSAHSLWELDLNEFLHSKTGILQRLLLDNFSLSIPVLIRNCPKLKSLHLKNVTFQNFEYDITLPSLSDLETLFLVNFDFNDDLVQKSVINILSSSQTRNSNKKLNCLKLHECVIDINFLQLVLSTCSNLKTVSFYNCWEITFDDIENLGKSFSDIKIDFADDYDIW